MSTGTNNTGLKKSITSKVAADQNQAKSNLNIKQILQFKPNAASIGTAIGPAAHITIQQQQHGKQQNVKVAKLKDDKTIQ